MPKLCQTPQCANQATHRHIIKLGQVKIAQQWVCSACKQILERRKS